MLRDLVQICLGGTHRTGRLAMACSCVLVMACGGKVMLDEGESGGTGGSGGSGGSGVGGAGGAIETGGGPAGGYGGGGDGGGPMGGYGGGGYGGGPMGGYGGGGYGGSPMGGYGGSPMGGYGGGTSCDLTTSDYDCDNCLQSLCWSECVYVQGLPEFYDYLMCIQGCSNTACYNGCDAQYPVASGATYQLQDCMAAMCSNECGGGPETCGLTTNDPTCDGCFQAACNMECIAATDDPQLMDYFDCMQGCVDQSCLDACDAQYPETSATMVELGNCMAMQCASECG